MLTCVFGFIANSISPFIVNLLTIKLILFDITFKLLSIFSVLFSNQGLVVKV